MNRECKDRMIDSSNPFEDEDEKDLSVYVCRLATRGGLSGPKRLEGSRFVARLLYGLVAGGSRERLEVWQFCWPVASAARSRRDGQNIALGNSREPLAAYLQSSHPAKRRPSRAWERIESSVRHGARHETFFEDEDEHDCVRARGRLGATPGHHADPINMPAIKTRTPPRTT
jgi:hypothetical protein